MPISFEPQNENEDRGRGGIAGAEDLGALGTGSDPDREGQFAALAIMRKNMEAVRLKIKMLGVDDGTGKNPGGVKMSFDEYVVMMRLKDPSVLIHSGKSLTDPVEVEEIAGVMPEIVPGWGGMDDPTKAKWNKRMELLSLMMQDPQMAGDTLAAMAENDPEMAEAIVYWKGKGVIDKMNNLNAGQLNKHGTKLTKKVVESRIMGPLTDTELKQYQADYERETGAQKVDPKLVKKERIGNGMIRTTVLNPDGSVAAQFVDGEVTLPSGQKIDISINGSSARDMDEVQDLADQTGGLFADGGAMSKNPGGKKKAPAASDDEAVAEEDVPEGYEGEPLEGEEPAESAGGGSSPIPGTSSAEEEPLVGEEEVSSDPETMPETDEEGMPVEGEGPAPIDPNDFPELEPTIPLVEGQYEGQIGQDDIDGAESPMLYNEGDPEKEHYHPLGEAETHGEQGNSVMTGGKGMQAEGEMEDDEDVGGTEDKPGSMDHNMHDKDMDGINDDTGESMDGIPDGVAYDFDGDGQTDDGYPGSKGGGSYPEAGAEPFPGSDATDPNEKIDAVMPYIPQKYRDKAGAFFFEALQDNPDLTTEDLIAMLPEEIQFEVAERMENSDRGSSAGGKYGGLKRKPKKGGGKKSAQDFEDDSYGGDEGEMVSIEGGEEEPEDEDMEVDASVDEEEEEDPKVVKQQKVDKAELNEIIKQRPDFASQVIAVLEEREFKGVSEAQAKRDKAKLMALIKEEPALASTIMNAVRKSEKGSKKKKAG